MTRKKKLLSATLTGSLLYSVMSVSAAAADDVVAVKKADEADLSTVVVTGYRNSIKKAFDIKLGSDSIMDAIVADDIGKLPDQNIAEAIARVPGVTITRGHGEGQFITVRGLGPEFNTALLNGRVLATENRGREYSFDILPAELISGVGIYKSPTADQAEGGIGSTVNMTTAQPLTLGNKAVISAQANYDRQRGKASPQTSGLWSMKSDDGTFGALASFSYINRKIEGQRIFTDGWEANQTVNNGATPIKGVSMPTYVEYGINDTNRKRLSGLATVQWKPTRDLLLTVDGLYSKLDVNDNNRVFFLYGGPGDVTAATVDSHNTINTYTGVGAELVTTQIRPRLANTKELGFNAKWNPAPNLSTAFDASYSKATDSTGGNQAWFDSNLNAVGFDPKKVQFHVSPNGLPVYDNLGAISDTTRATMGWLTWEGLSVADEVKQASFNLKYKFGASVLKSIEFGLNYSDRQKDVLSYKSPGSVQSLFTGISLPQSLFTTSSNANNFMDSGMFSAPFPGYSVYDLQSYLLSDAAINKTANPAATRAAIAANGGNLGVQFVPGESGSAREKTFGSFIQASFGGNVRDHDWSGNLGVRYVNTKEISKGVGQEVLDIVTKPGLDPVVVLSGPVPLTEEGAYKQFLPSANLKLDVTDGLMFQLAAAKSMTRATLSNLMITRSINARERERNISDGNPNLRPMLAQNYDASLTWYNDKGSYVSAAYFAKNLTNLLKSQTNTVKILGQDFFLTRPENIGSDHMHGYELSGQYIFSALPTPFDGFGVQGNYTSAGSTKTYNAVAFYEKGPFQIRVAYNYRNAYEETDRGNRGQPVDVAAYGQTDASLSYAWSKNLTFFMQGINLNNAKYLKYSVYPERVISYEAYGPRYAAGARMTF